MSSITAKDSIPKDNIMFSSENFSSIWAIKLYKWSLKLYHIKLHAVLEILINYYGFHSVALYQLFQPLKFNDQPKFITYQDCFQIHLHMDSLPIRFQKVAPVFVWRVYRNDSFPKLLFILKSRKPGTQGLAFQIRYLDRLNPTQNAKLTMYLTHFLSRLNPIWIFNPKLNLKPGHI